MKVRPAGAIASASENEKDESADPTDSQNAPLRAIAEITIAVSAL